jgi:hypothetical protein
MAKQRIVNTKFWDDKYIRSLSPNGKLLFLYLFTNSLTTIAGAYEITLDRIVFDTGLPEPEASTLLKKFETDKKAAYRDDWVFLPNSVKHQSVGNPKILKGIEEAAKCCPDWIKHSLSVRYDSLSHLNPNSNFNSNPKSEKRGVSPSGENATPRKPTKPVDTRKSHPAIVCVLNVAGRYPPKDLWDSIIKALGGSPDIDFFSESYRLWRAVNGSPTNYEKWLFEPARTGKMPEVYGGKNGAPKQLAKSNVIALEQSADYFERKYGDTGS